MPRPASLNNLSLLGGAASPGAADDESWHWTRWLFSSKMPESYPLLVHGFDVALVAELAKVEALYARELEVLESRWQDSLADDDDAAPSDGEGFASEGVAMTPPRTGGATVLLRTVRASAGCCAQNVAQLPGDLARAAPTATTVVVTRSIDRLARSTRSIRYPTRRKNQNATFSGVNDVPVF